MMLISYLLACGAVADSGTVADTSTADTSEDTATDSGGEPPDLHGEVPEEALPAPEFAATNRDGSSRGQADLTDGPTVMWFYPAAGTYGWTKEGCGYRDRQEQFDALGVQIVGVSFDTPEDNQAFAEAESFTYELWSDDDKTLALYYGAIARESASAPGRVTRILDADGVLVLEYDEVDFGTSPQEVLEDCEVLFGG